MSDSKARILLLDFPNQYLLTATLMRFQEHYESPRFRNQTFTWEQFMDWYATTRGTFSYNTDWTGFNFPSYVVKTFREGGFDPLHRKEAAVLELLRDIPEPYYVIGTYGGNTVTLAHEVVHGLFAGHGDYAKMVRSVIRRAYRSDRNVRAGCKQLYAALKEMGYCEEVLEDELNAYVITGYSAKMSKDTQRKLRPLQLQLWALFKERFGVDLSRTKNHQKMLQFVTRLPYAELEKRFR